jgi:hypothetical protein
VVTTFSAPDLSANTISAATLGCFEVILQSIKSPPTDSIADSISAAVVPGAKLFPNTTHGPGAVPLMAIPAPLFRIVLCPPSGRRADTRRSSFEWRLLAEDGRDRKEVLLNCEEGLLAGLVLKLADAERWTKTKKAKCQTAGNNPGGGREAPIYA